jgi:hypothetical protein
MKRLLLMTCMVFFASWTLAHMSESLVTKAADSVGTQWMALDVVPDGIPDWHVNHRFFLMSCFGLCTDMESAE